MEALSTTQAAVVAATVEDQTSRDRDPEEVILLTVIRCLGLLYAYFQIRLLCNLGSKYTLGKQNILSKLSMTQERSQVFFSGLVCAYFDFW